MAHHQAHAQNILTSKNTLLWVFGIGIARSRRHSCSRPVSMRVEYFSIKIIICEAWINAGIPASRLFSAFLCSIGFWSRAFTVRKFPTLKWTIGSAERKSGFLVLDLDDTKYGLRALTGRGNQGVSILVEKATIHPGKKVVWLYYDLVKGMSKRAESTDKGESSRDSVKRKAELAYTDPSCSLIDSLFSMNLRTFPLFRKQPFFFFSSKSLRGPEVLSLNWHFHLAYYHTFVPTIS